MFTSGQRYIAISYHWEVFLNAALFYQEKTFLQPYKLIERADPVVRFSVICDP